MLANVLTYVSVCVVYGGVPAVVVSVQQQCLLLGRVWLLFQPGQSMLQM